MRYWYIEDAGGGCRVFSEVLVLVCETPRLVYKRFLPLSWSKDLTMEEMACRAVLDMMREAGADDKDYYYVCSGNIFYDLHNWLTENCYKWETVKMDGLAHEVAETAFYNQIIAAGFPEDIKLEERNYKDFYLQVNAWIKENPYRRQFFKDMEVRRKPEQSRYLLKGNSAHTRVCSGCRKKIPPYIPVVQYRYRENGRKKSRYYHPDCSPVKAQKNKLEKACFTWRGEMVEGVVLPVQKPLICSVCGTEIAIGAKAVHARKEKELIYGHLECIENTDNRLRNIN